MKKTILNCPVDFDRSSFLDLLSLSVGWSIACQNRLGELIGDNGWNVDLKSGTIKFGEHIFKSGVLGTESSSSGTWLWAWENTEGGLPEIAAAPSRRAKKQLGDCPEFTNGKFMLDELHTGHNLAMVCCAVSDKDICYYRCPHSEGAAFVTVEELPEDIFAPLDAQSLLRQIMEIISVFYCDHRLLTAGLLHMNGNLFTADDRSISAEFDGRSIRFTFEATEEIYRLVDVNFN
ncbi:MAG: hypothetical protein IJZ47_11535 [Oscillospiraceae bacterium]|nr:hypothetical protein [Oscillospiraceae bacterium]